MNAQRRLKVLGVLTIFGIVSLVLFPKISERMSRKRRLAEVEGIRVPEGFIVERVAVPDLVAYPMLGTLDDRGRLFLCESSGKNVTTEEMKANPEFRIRLLEDLNGDGIYDRSQVFADKLTMPAGAVWYRKSLYVASPPDLIRFDDTNNDGIADRREVVLTGWNLS